MSFPHINLTFHFFTLFPPALRCTSLFFILKKKSNIRKAKYKECSLTSQALVHGKIFPVLVIAILVKGEKCLFC